MAFRRPLPVPPGPNPFSSSQYSLTKPLDIYDPLPNPYSAAPYSGSNDYYNKPSTILPGGTLIHKGFYDLLSMIPTPNPSRLLWGTPSNEPVAGPRYEELPPAKALPPISPPLSPPPVKKGRRISKDMVSKPTGFVYVISLFSAPASPYPHLHFNLVILSMRLMHTRPRNYSLDGVQMVSENWAVCHEPFPGVFRSPMSQIPVGQTPSRTESVRIIGQELSMKLLALSSLPRQPRQLMQGLWDPYVS